MPMGRISVFNIYVNPPPPPFFQNPVSAPVVNQYLYKQIGKNLNGVLNRPLDLLLIVLSGRILRENIVSIKIIVTSPFYSTTQAQGLDYVTHYKDLTRCRDRSLIVVRGVQKGKIAGPKLFAPPPPPHQDRMKLFVSAL